MTGRGGIAAAVSLLLFPLACAPAPEQTAAPAPELDHVTAVVMPFLSQMPLHVALAEGFFRDEGIDVEFVRVGRSQELMAALARGEVDAVTGLLTVNELNAIAAGVRVRAVAALASPEPDGCTFLALIARTGLAESGALDDPDRLREMVFDTDPLVPLGYQVDLLLRRRGLGLDDVEVVNLPPPAGLDAMRTGAVDVILENEPFLSEHLRAGTATVWVPVQEITPGYPHSVLLYGSRLLDEQPDLGTRFVRALLRGMERFREGKTERNLQIVEEASGLSRDRLEAACWPTAPAGARVDVDAVRGYQEWSVTRGLLTGVLPDDQIIDSRFVELAAAKPDR